jgi:hypothetical protein
MTDRELLELAAKAAGLTIKKSQFYPRETLVEEPPGEWNLWIPLEDDGDAFRLFTKMPFCTLYVSEIGVTVNLPRPEGRVLGLKCDEYAEEHGGDIYAATRRAIVRAAAAIGESK